MDSRLDKQLAFLNEVEKLKVVYRRNKTSDRSRHENSAEHSWHVALFALVLAEHRRPPDLDMFKVVKMLLIHDLVEVYSGDTWVYDAAASASQAESEHQSATVLFGMLPDDQATEFMALWREFEESASAEARFAAALDSLQPLANHVLSGAADDHGPKPTVKEVMDRKQHISSTSTVLWDAAQSLIRESVKRGLYQ